MARLGDYVKIRTGKLDANAACENGQYPFFTCSVEPLRIDTYSYDCECVLVAGNGDLNVKYYNGKFDAYQRTYIIESNDKSVLSVPYLFCFLEKYIETLRKQAIGGVIKYIKLGNLTEADIPLCSLEEQKRVVSLFEKVDFIIANTSQQLAKLDELVKSRFIELFGDLERTTTIARYISELRGGKSLAGTEPCKNKVLKTGAATFGWFDPEQYKYLPADYEPLPEHKVETGDVIISRMNTPELVGACSYVFDAPEDMYYPDRLWKAVLKENTNPIFLWQLLWDRDIRKAIKESSGGTSGTMHNISKANLLAIKCMDAPIELQNEYAEFVKQTDKSKLAIQESLAKLETLKKSLMQQCFG